VRCDRTYDRNLFTNQLGVLNINLLQN